MIGNLSAPSINALLCSRKTLYNCWQLDYENTSIHHRGRKTPTHDIVEDNRTLSEFGTAELIF